MPSSAATPSTDEQQRAAEVLRRLKVEYPDAKCSLDFTTPLELLVATILSAQCTDKLVNTVTASLFKKYRSPEDYAQAQPEEMEQDIRKIIFYRNKAKHLRETGRILTEQFGGEVPRTIDELIRLPGVARKTANVVLGNAYGLIYGMVVDTHVGRLSRRLGFTDSEDPVKVEQDLMALFPQEEWLNLSHLLIYHGRAVCQARQPLCAQCVLSDLCLTGKQVLAGGSAATSATSTRAKRRG